MKEVKELFNITLYNLFVLSYQKYTSKPNLIAVFTFKLRHNENKNHSRLITIRSISSSTLPAF